MNNMKKRAWACRSYHAMPRQYVFVTGTLLMVVHGVLCRSLVSRVFVCARWRTVENCQASPNHPGKLKDLQKSGRQGNRRPDFCINRQIHLATGGSERFNIT